MHFTASLRHCRSTARLGLVETPVEFSPKPGRVCSKGPEPLIPRARAFGHELAKTPGHWESRSPLRHGQRRVQHAGQHVFLVAPDQAVVPFGGAARAEQVEGHLALLGALVHRFNGLEGERQTQGGSDINFLLNPQA